jgi:uncharacterized protein
MKVLAVSDNVLPQLENADYLQRTYADIDMIISCGDMPAPYVDYIASVLDAPLFFVRGNHDQNYEAGFPGGEDLHRKAIKYRGVWFAGLEGSMVYNYSPVQYSDISMFNMAIRLAPGMLWRRLRRGSGVDVFVTHAPPRGIHDMPDRPHQGFRALRLVIAWYRPRYLIHGHVDVLDRRRAVETQFDHTFVININPVRLLTVEPLTGRT